MRTRDERSRPDDALIAAFDASPELGLSPWPSQPDLDRGLRQRPGAIAALRSPTQQRRCLGVARGVAARVGWCLLGIRYRVATTAVGLVVLIALGPAIKAEEEFDGSASKAGAVRIKSPHLPGSADRMAQAINSGGVGRRRSAPINTTPLLAGGRADAGSAGRVPLSIWMAQASAAVRARMVRITDDAIVCEVVRVIYGKVPGKTLHSAGLPWTPLSRKLSGDEPGRKPTAAKIRTAVSETYKFKAGREVILTLGSCRKTDQRVVAPFLRIFHDAPGWRSLDQLEKEMVDILAAGEHMMPRCIPEAMQFYIPSCDRIVRGRLAKRDARTAQWEVASVLFYRRGKPAESNAPGAGPRWPRRLIIGLDPWQLRAEAVVAYRATQDPKRSATEEAVRKEFTRLIRAELPVGREAILLVRTLPRSPGGPVRYKLVAIVFANAEGQSIERLQETMLQMIATGEHLNLNM